MRYFTTPVIAFWMSTALGVTFAAGPPPVPQGTPKRVASAAPVYPRAAARRHLRGPVVVELTVDATGVVQHVSAVRGDRLLVAAAVAAARHWRFQARDAPVRLFGGINVGPGDPDTAPNISPPPLLPVSTAGSTAATVPRGVPGKAKMSLTLGVTGQVTDAIGLAGTNEVLIEALDGALRWRTEPLLVGGIAKSFECLAEWSRVDVVRVGDRLERAECYRVTPEARAAEHAGATVAPVVVEIVIDARGVVTDTHVLRSGPVFEQAALEAVRLWRFGPLFLNGIAVPTIQSVVVPFRTPRRP